MSHLSAVAVGSDQCGSGHIHIISDSTEHRANTAEGSPDGGVLISHRWQGRSYFSMDRERTADMVRSMHPKGPSSNCVWKRRQMWENVFNLQPLDPETLPLPARYAAPQTAAGYWSYQKWNRSSKKTNRLSHKRGQTCLQSFLFYICFCPLLMTQILFSQLQWLRTFSSTPSDL